MDPTRTLLQYLREDDNRPGTKEGCAEGDCGACTVVVAELEPDQSTVRYRAMNACIQFLPTLHGKGLFTVESLISQSGQMHPVQGAIVDCHASQCGFCTPGFVMSMFALYQTTLSPNRRQIDDALSGNLCRCTGYKPIIEACYRMGDYPLHADQKVLIEDLPQKLRSIEPIQATTDLLPTRHCVSPASIDEFARYYDANPQAQILAGGTDVGLWVTKQHRQLDQLLYLGNVDELAQIDQSEAGVRIGAAVTLEDAFAVLSESFGELEEVFRRFASAPIRNAGTLVGNIANGSPIGDSMPILICLGSSVRLRKGSENRDIDLQDLYLDYQKKDLKAGEWVESVLIPARDPQCQIASYKIAKRFDQDISAVCAAFFVKLDHGNVSEIKIAYGGMAAIPKRASLTEAYLSGKSWDENNIQQAMLIMKEDYEPLSDMRASNQYRRQVASNLLMRFYLQTSVVADSSHNVFELTA